MSANHWKNAPVLLAAGLFLSVMLGGGGTTLRAEQLSLDVGVSNPTMLAGEKQLNHIRISLTGFDVPQNESRPPVNTAIVIDQSGSMGGQKIVQAREAAIAAVRRLRDDDIVSIVLYADSATVLVPATKATDRKSIIQKIRSVTAGGSTALFAGVSKGAAEVRKFLDKDSVNRVILLSDGQANVGPKSPRELERLGASLVKEGISVSTLGLGLGYNEDLMSRLASAGSGNHMFVEQADDLVAVFQKEFNDLMSVVASDFEIHAKIGEGIRPVRVLNNKADISGQDIYIPLAQLYARQQRYFVIEVEVPAGEAGSKRPLASVTVQYQNMLSKTTDTLTSSIEIRFTDDKAAVAKECDHETAAYCAIQLANEKNVQATALRDAGRIQEAKQLLLGNSAELQKLDAMYGGMLADELSSELKRNAKLNQDQSAIIESPSAWNYSRKSMRYEQSKNAAQQQMRVKVAPPSDK
ncbi:von Willebrand factor type A domain protein [Stieleria maiorica]|uniref:von Willebrand factor type A domain protein n=1 Tax=Stieleria maiorica TaxID=2795974 RepID=A0A5B9MDM7_9BACT|nr:VWA domain-containing protein [Stieleria maiorica]QEF98060.1 von Willebrand factor type A domain protein [Stieleria maiorica]